MAVRQPWRKWTHQALYYGGATINTTNIYCARPALHGTPDIGKMKGTRCYDIDKSFHEICTFSVRHSVLLLSQWTHKHKINLRILNCNYRIRTCSNVSGTKKSHKLICDWNEMYTLESAFITEIRCYILVVDWSDVCSRIICMILIWNFLKCCVL